MILDQVQLQVCSGNWAENIHNHVVVIEAGQTNVVWLDLLSLIASHHFHHKFHDLDHFHSKRAAAKIPVICIDPINRQVHKEIDNRLECVEVGREKT